MRCECEAVIAVFEGEDCKDPLENELSVVTEASDQTIAPQVLRSKKDRECILVSQ